MAKYNKVALNPMFNVTHIVEILYRGFPKEKNADQGKNNDFWCFYYVDRGHVIFHRTDGAPVTVNAGQGIFFAPFEPFAYFATTTESANLLSLFFICPNLDKATFHQKRCSFDTFEKMILSNLITSSYLHFERHSNSPAGPKGQKPKADAPADTLPFVKASLEYLLLLLNRKKADTAKQTKLPAQQNNLLVNLAIEYMYQNLNKKLTAQAIAAHVKMSESNFRAIFKKHTHQSVIAYFHTLKIEQAKILIRQDIYTQSELAAALGYSSESYFCRHFKQKTGMTPTEYAHLVYYG